MAEGVARRTRWPSPLMGEGWVGVISPLDSAL